MQSKCAIPGAVTLLTLVAVAAPCAAQTTTLDAPAGWIQPALHDSGVLANPQPAAAVVYSETIEIEGAAWLRLYFESVDLGPESSLRVTSLLDDEVQVLDGAALEAWGMSTAYFNGDAVLLELVAGPSAPADRVVVGSIGLDVVGGVAGAPGQCGICGADSRVPSNELWIARLMPAGCTASVINSRSCMVTAGHCGGAADIVQFNVPDSNDDCSLVNPPVDEQFPITEVSFTNAGVGADWAVLIAGTNGQGQSPYQRYGEHRAVAEQAVSSGTPASLTGYGADQTCSRHKTQQTDNGSISGVAPTFYQFSVDLREGNSGSALLANGKIVGVATHCPCPNAATRADIDAFVAAREALCPMPGDVNADGVVDVEDIILVIVGWGCRGACNGDANGDGVVDVEDLVVVLLDFG